MDFWWAFAILLFIPRGEFVSPSEYSALADLYDQLNGPNWVFNAGWMTGDPCAGPIPWYGVNCTQASTIGHVSMVSLPKNALVGTLPPSFIDLFGLATLDLSFNNVTGTIPHTISSMFFLQTLDLGTNALVGEIPTEMGNLSAYSLQTIDLAVNNLSGTVPDFFEQDKNNFVSVDLRNNPFLCPLPPAVAYTGATCLNLTLRYSSSTCYSESSPRVLMIYGENLIPLDGMLCVLDSEHYSFAGVASVVSSTEVFCSFAPGELSLDDCTGKRGEGLFEPMELYLSFDSSGPPLSNSIRMNIMNNRCTYMADPHGLAYIPGKNQFIVDVSSNPELVAFPSTLAIESACAAGVAKPFRCPPKVTITQNKYQYFQSTFDLSYCSENEQDCMWVPGVGVNQCPYYSQASRRCVSEFMNSGGVYYSDYCNNFISADFDSDGRREGRERTLGERIKSGVESVERSLLKGARRLFG